MQVVRMLVGISGTRDGVDWPPRGGTVALPDDEAAALVCAGMAEDAGPAEVEVAADVAKPSARGARKSGSAA